jgi:hypothetical protein
MLVFLPFFGPGSSVFSGLAMFPADFGVIITCARKDFLFAKGCCASVRQYLPQVPICLLVDGDFDLDQLPQLYQVQVLDRRTVRDPFLRDQSFGYGITKMVAFWESPFEYFLLLDADTVLWGDLRPLADFARHDLVIDQPTYAYQPADIETWFFNLAKLRHHYPDFEPLNYDQLYTCTGVTFARRGVLDLGDYQRGLRQLKSEPGLFLSGEMGLLNFLYFDGAARGKFRLGHADTQYLVPDFTRAEAAARFPLVAGQPAMAGPPNVIHYNGDTKPTLDNTAHYIEPMVHFRQQFLQARHGGLAPAAVQAILQREDAFFRQRPPLWQRALRKLGLR